MEKLKHPNSVKFRVVIDKGHCRGHINEVFSIRREQLGKWSCTGRDAGSLIGDHRCCKSCLGQIKLPWQKASDRFDIGVCCGVIDPDMWCLEVVT